MKSRLLRRLISAGVLTTSLAMIAGGGIGQAATPNISPHFFTTQVQQIRAAGSETTFYVTNQLQSLWSQSSIFGCTLVSSDLRTCNTTADGSATDVQDNYSRTEFINGLGNGSGNGIGQLCGTKPNGGLTVDFARASRAPKASDGCSGTGGTTGLNFADDSVVGLVFPYENTTTLTCAAGDTCTGTTQVGPVANGWRPGDAVAGPTYSGNPVTDISNDVAFASLGGKSEAFRIYCDKGGRTTNADIIVLGNSASPPAPRSIGDATQVSSDPNGVPALSSATNLFDAGTDGIDGKGDVNAYVTGTGINANAYITKVTTIAGLQYAELAIAVAPGGSTTVFSGSSVSGVTVDQSAVIASPKVTDAQGNALPGEFAQGDVGQTISGAGIPASTTVQTLIDTNHIILSQDTTGTKSTTVQVTLGGSGLAINDWGQITDPAHVISGTVTTLGASIGAPIYIPAINTGSGTYSTWQSYVGCDPNTKNKDGHIVQENDGPQIADVAGIGTPGSVAASDNPTNNIAAANQVAESLYYISYGVSQWKPYTYTTNADVEVAGSPQVQSGLTGLELTINGTSATPLNEKQAPFIATHRQLFFVVRNDAIRGSVAGFINWVCDTNPATHGTDLTNGKNYAADITAQIGTVFVFPQVPCLLSGGVSVPPINAPGGATPSVTSALLNS